MVTDIAQQLTFSILDIENVARMIGTIAADLVSMGTPVGYGECVPDGVQQWTGGDLVWGKTLHIAQVLIACSTEP